MDDFGGLPRGFKGGIAAEEDLLSTASARGASTVSAGADLTDGLPGGFKGDMAAAEESVSAVSAGRDLRGGLPGLRGNFGGGDMGSPAAAPFSCDFSPPPGNLPPVAACFCSSCCCCCLAMAAAALAGLGVPVGGLPAAFHLRGQSSE